MKTYVTAFKNALIIRGILAIIFGLFTLLYPGLALAIFIWIFGIFAIADGVFSIFISISKIKTEENWWLQLLQGIFGALVGALVLSVPGLTVVFLGIYIAAWIIFIGAFEIIAAIRVRKLIKGEGWYIASGALSMLIGFFILSNPMGGALSFTWLIGAYALVFGIILIVTAVNIGNKLKKLAVQ